MIGADYFWDLVQGPLEKLPSGFWLVSSVFGTLLSGKGKIEQAREHFKPHTFMECAVAQKESDEPTEIKSLTHSLKSSGSWIP